MENANITVHMDDADAMTLFKTHGWTLDYKISNMKCSLDGIGALSGFEPSAYYFVYNNELSKDIGLDMSEYPDIEDIEVDIYRIYESMPEEFYPIQSCRGIVVKDGEKIIGAFISAGRHSAFNACSLKGNSFEKATGQDVYEWIAGMIEADGIEERLSKLEPEKIIGEYFAALGNKDAKTATYCISKKNLLGNLTTNIPNNELFNEATGLPLTDSGIEAESIFENLKSSKLLKAELVDEPDEYTRIFKVTVDIQYNREFTISSGEQHWYCRMAYESPQTGWKIESFGH